MTRIKYLMLLGLILSSAQATAWDLGVDYGVESATLGEYYTGATGTNSKNNTPGFDLSIPVMRYSLTDYSGELAAGLSNLTRSMAAQEGAHQDAIADAEAQIREGRGNGVGHGSRTWTLAEPVEGRTVISYATGSTTGGTFKGASGTGVVLTANTMQIDYLRNMGSGVWESLYGSDYAFDISIQYKSYDMTYLIPATGAKRADNRQMLGMPVAFTLAHGLGLRGLQAEIYGDFDVLMGLTYFAKLNGLSYGYGTRINYKTLGFLSVFAGYDVRAYTKSSVDVNDDKSARIEGPTQMAAWKLGVSVDLGYLFNLVFTKVE